MGGTYSFRCKKCKEEYSVWLGIGFLYPKEYEELTADIKSGRFGEELKKAFSETEYAAVNGEETLFVCDHCGYWKTGKDLTVWGPDDPEKTAKKQFGIKTVEEWGHIPYAMRTDLEEAFHVVKRYDCRCDGCGKTMRNAGSGDIAGLACPKCGTYNEPQKDRRIMWD